MTSDDLLRRGLVAALWIGWAGWWWLNARDVKATTRREPVVSRLLHLVPMAAAAALLGWPRLGGVLDRRFLPDSPSAFWCGVALLAGGLAFAIRARHQLGRNWSAIVTLKQDHELVTSGPYALVRHPIYTGLLLGFLGSALTLGQWRGLVAVGLFLVTAIRKYRLEERWMRERFGVAYDAYRARVKALVPFLF